MIRRLRDARGGGTSVQAADAAVGRGMADLLAGLDNVIDDDAALGRIYAGLGKSVPGAAPGGGAPPARAGGPAAPRRRLALGSVAGAAVLIAAVAALATIVLPGAGRGRAEERANLAGYVVKRVDRALTAADPGAIAQMTVTTRSVATAGGTTATTTAEEWSYGERWRAVTYSAAGQLRYDEGSGTASVYTVVSYQARTWARRRGLGGPATLAPAPRGCAPEIAALPLPFQPGLPGGAPAGSLPATVARELRAAISCGTLAVAGRQRIGGIEAIELTSGPGSPIPETVWVSPGTYLPVRVVIRPISGQPGLWQTADVSWLPPTAPNLAKLTVPIPAGFRKVPFAEAAAPLMQHVAVP
jgi:hypothetical protein